MYWMIAALLIVGVLAGATIRLPMFVVVLLVAAVVAVLSLLPQGIGPAVLHAVVAVVVLQIGYGCGILLRSAIRAARVPLAKEDRVRQESRVRLPSEPKQR